MPEEDIPQPGSADQETQMMTPPTGGGSILPPSATPLREIIGDYEVLAKLGAGGMGAVYRARQVSLGRTVALKILPSHMIADEESVARFQREARVAAGVSHANLVRVFAAGEADGSHFIAMELIEGEDLGRRLKRDGSLPAPEALRITAEVARGLEHAWRTAHLIHRDIKPANIFLAADGTVKVGDLGIAKSVLGNTTDLTQTGAMMGTPLYMSPEQARADRETDFRADIYSLGCTLYQMLTGRAPYTGRDAITIIRQHLDAPLPAILKAWPQCPVPLARLVGRMLKKGKHERPASYAELIGQIQTVWAQIDPLSYHPEAYAPPGSPDETDPTTPVPTPTPRVIATPQAPPPTKSKLPLYSALAVAVLLIILGGVFFLLPRQEKLTQAQLYAQQKEAKSTAQQTPNPPPNDKPVSPHLPPEPAAWQPFLTKAEWERGGKEFEFRDGMIHVRGGVFQPLATPDAAIRARYVFRSEGRNVSLFGRGDAQGGYKLRIGTAALFFEYVGEGIFEKVGDTYSFPEPLKDGQRMTVELRIVGPRLSAFIDGQKVLEVQDDRKIKAGLWALMGQDAWFESAEVLLIPPSTADAPSSSEPWQDVMKLITDTHPGLRRPDGGYVFQTKDAYPVLRTNLRDGAIRILVEPVDDHIDLRLRDFSGESYRFNYSRGGPSLQLSEASIELDKWTGTGSDIPEAGKPVELEARAVGNRLTATLNGRTVIDVKDDSRERGSLMLRLPPGTILHRAEILDLDTPRGAGAATKDAPFVNSLGMRFVPVPITGGPTDGQRVLFSIWETRVQDYQQFKVETGRPWSSPNYPQEPTHPAVQVNWDDAVAFCAWLTERDRQAGKLGLGETYRLPSDHEWSCAVGIGTEENAANTPSGKNQEIPNRHPWGTAWPPPAGTGNFPGEESADQAVTIGQQVISGYRDAYPRTAPVGSYSANALGLCDLDGNVREWCADWMDASRERRVLRGGAFTDGSPPSLWSSRRNGAPPNSAVRFGGFRVVLAAGP